MKAKSLDSFPKVIPGSYIIPKNEVFSDPESARELQENWEKYWQTYFLLTELLTF